MSATSTLVNVDGRDLIQIDCGRGQAPPCVAQAAVAFFLRLQSVSASYAQLSVV
jgi:hypothetical protein